MVVSCLGCRGHFFQLPHMVVTEVQEEVDQEVQDMNLAFLSTMVGTGQYFI
jgi:hypothetical protein